MCNEPERWTHAASKHNRRRRIWQSGEIGRSQTLKEACGSDLEENKTCSSEPRNADRARPCLQEDKLRMAICASQALCSLISATAHCERVALLETRAHVTLGALVRAPMPTPPCRENTPIVYDELPFRRSNRRLPDSQLFPSACRAPCYPTQLRCVHPKCTERASQTLGRRWLCHT